MRVRSWAPPVVWMAIILVLATDTGSAPHTSRLLVPVLEFVMPWATPLQIEALHGLVRKAAHVVEYAILTVLWVRAFISERGWSPRIAAWAALGISVVWACVDESIQRASSTRSGNPADVLLDATGAAAAAFAAGSGWRHAIDAATLALLWLAAVGGAGALVLNLVLGVDSGWLWLTSPAAAILLILRRRGRATDTRARS